MNTKSSMIALINLVFAATLNAMWEEPQNTSIQASVRDPSNQSQIIKGAATFIIHGPYNCLKHEENGYVHIMPGRCTMYESIAHSGHTITYFNIHSECIRIENHLGLAASGTHATPRSRLCRFAETHLDPSTKKRAVTAIICKAEANKKIISFYDKENRIIFCKTYEGKAKLFINYWEYFKNFINLDELGCIQNKTINECVIL